MIVLMRWQQPCEKCRCSSSVIGHFFGQFLRGVACPSDLPMIIVGLPTMLPHHHRRNQYAYQ
jgi:hypothetical protein